MKPILFGLSLLEIIGAMTMIKIAWDSIDCLFTLLFRKKRSKEPKIKKEFRITVFGERQSYFFAESEVKKWSSYDGGELKITKFNGDKVWFKKLPFMVETFIVKENESPIL